MADPNNDNSPSADAGMEALLNATAQEKIDALMKMLSEATRRIKNLEDRMKDLRDFDGNKMISKVQWEEPFDCELPGDGNLILRLDEEELRSQVGGGGGSSGLSFRIGLVTNKTSTGVVDANGNPVQWTYTIAEQLKDAVGYGGWNNAPNGYQGTAFHLFEDNNTGIGRQMNGVNHDGADYPSLWMMQNVQVGAYVLFFQVRFMVGTAEHTEAWFVPAPNGEDGLCSSSGGS